MAEKLGLFAAALIRAAFLGAFPAFGVGLVTHTNSFALWLLSTWVHLIWAKTEEGNHDHA